MKRRDLGRHLEWHGDRIRVVMKVPPSQRAEFGTKVREVLITRDQLEAEREKLDVIRRIKAKLKGVKTLATQKPLIEEALRWRQAAQDEAVATGLTDEQTTVAEALSNRVARIEAIHGPQEAQQFAAVASGTGTPLRALLDIWFEEHSFTNGYQEDVRRVLGRLEACCRHSAACGSTRSAVCA
ncbi:hypothetical protein FNL55_03210 [Tardiphaga sp. vice352]|uniref:hypothetical protein n=1 Tax=unclassified Tardiphaga TaxID=2631404 RepID=UPI001163A846|nr:MULTISPECIES: hypothetical protein [unclassified Tardiphaga]QDM15066.1 hypothetical protein FNL53_03160 [Tardiphaga sp. vice278]QDM20179.1 hypothetical protein FIU28_02655 [Tardiphaga sp. vice154]QDM25255.1 hypothetical protein FNL56_03130 [Tardiphaga sp. vice304]QDM30463.1 hypothetical protein FNL55_03210 [Tardiphaga sp. vice352]